MMVVDGSARDASEAKHDMSRKFETVTARIWAHSHHPNTIPVAPALLPLFTPTHTLHGPYVLYYCHQLIRSGNMS